jgi:hypothetical protein
MGLLQYEVIGLGEFHEMHQVRPNAAISIQSAEYTRTLHPVVPAGCNFFGVFVMISIEDEDIVHELRTSGGRFILCSSTDLPAESIIGFYGACVHVGGDAVGILAKLNADSAPNGWTAFDLLLIALKLNLRESEKRPSDEGAEVERHLRGALAVEGKRVHRTVDLDEVSFDDSDGYLYAFAGRGDGDLWLLEYPEDPDGEGISGEQLILIAQRIMLDAIGMAPPNAFFRACEPQIAQALDAEVRRVNALRAAAPAAVSGGR